MFNLFSRILPSSSALPPKETDAPNATSEDLVEAGPSNSGDIAPDFQFPKQQQLHTPSPSVDDVSAIAAAEPAPPKPKPKPRVRKPKAKPKEISPPILSGIPPGPVDTPSPTPEDVIVIDPSPLYALITSVPAQTLHSYTLARLNPTLHPLPSSASILPELTPTILTALTTFFSTLTPPPKLHCLRCHRGYFDLENNDTACRVAHDDDSAIVERVGLGKGAAEYETLWGCCNQTVDGDGDMGPPDGWCYEGAHTTDAKRARFRADSTPQNDKLLSCARLRCGLPPLPPRSSLDRASRKRARQTMEGDTDEDEDDEAQSLTSSHTRSHSRAVSMASIKGKMKEAPEDADAEIKARPTKRPRSRKQSTSMLPPAAKESADDKAMDVDAPQQLSPPKSPRRKAAAAFRAKPLSSGSMPAQRSPLSASFIPAAVFISRSESPTRKPRSQVEVQIISRSPPKTLSDKVSSASLKRLKGMGGISSLSPNTRTRALGEIVDTSVEGEGSWH